MLVLQAFKQGWNGTSEISQFIVKACHSLNNSTGAQGNKSRPIIIIITFYIKKNLFNGKISSAHCPLQESMGTRDNETLFSHIIIVDRLLLLTIFLFCDIYFMFYSFIDEFIWNRNWMNNALCPSVVTNGVKQYKK